MFGIESLNAASHRHRYCAPRSLNSGIHWRAGESHPVGVPRGAAFVIPGLRCAAPWAVESGPFGAGGLRPLLSPERASFHSPGCNPGLKGNDQSVALTGRHSPDAPTDNEFHYTRIVPRCHICDGAAAHALAARSGDSPEYRPVGAYAFLWLANPGLRCAAPWAMEFGPFGAGGLRPLRSPERASFHSPGWNPGLSDDDTNVALKGRHSPDAPTDAGPHHGRFRPGTTPPLTVRCCTIRAMTASSRTAAARKRRTTSPCHDPTPTPLELN